ncbi:dynein regulatory complex protein 10 [Clarias gariepinus]|uniref:dynein regulatory complex protein 10 n=1 Tax=Clarias gariepinus TaxID=13013 RepID=UPI00234D7C42|nr:dynein regulatory complex protein 10 [Clarias gariepinus]
MATRTRKKLVPPEVQCILTVLDECVHKIDVISVLPCELMHPRSIPEELGDTAVESLRNHLRLTRELCSLQDTDAAKDKSMASGVQDSLRDFLRHLRPHIGEESVKTALQGAGPIVEEDREAVQALQAGLQEFRDVLMERLMVSSREERERRRLGEDVRERQQRNVKLLNRVEQEVRAATKHRDDVIGKKEEAIRRIKVSLHQMEREWEEFVQSMQKKAEQQHQSDLRNSEVKQLRLREEANQLRAQLENLVAQNRERKTTLRTRNSKLETEIENWIQKYDTEMGGKQEKLERLTRAYEEERAELQQLQEHFSVLELEYSQIVEEQRRECERREEEERDRETKSRAAVVIQAFWRGWRVRNAMKKKSKGKKGKKGKSKKGK